MNASDRKTPVDPPRRARVPRPEAIAVDNERRVVHSPGAVQGRLVPAPPPLPASRHQTPQSGGIEAQPAKVPPVVVVEEGPLPTSRPPTKGDWAKLRFKLASAVVAALIAAVGALGVYAVAAINARAEAKKATQQAKESKATTDEQTPRVAKLEAYIRADAERDKCVEAQLRDALTRGTGHVVLSLPDEPGAWAEQNKPKAQARTIWPVPTWFTTKVCPPKPTPP